MTSLPYFIKTVFPLNIFYKAILNVDKNYIMPNLWKSGALLVKTFFQVSLAAMTTSYPGCLQIQKQFHAKLYPQNVSYFFHRFFPQRQTWGKFCFIWQKDCFCKLATCVGFYYLFSFNISVKRVRTSKPNASLKLSPSQQNWGWKFDENSIALSKLWTLCCLIFCHFILDGNFFQILSSYNKWINKL